jgi:hypothetical protein
VFFPPNIHIGKQKKHQKTGERKNEENKYRNKAKSQHQKEIGEMR